MMTADTTRNRDRLRAGLAVVALHALLGYALIVGLGVAVPPPVADSLKLFDLRAVPPPPRAAIAPARRAPRKSGAASPPNVRSQPSEIVVPVPAIPMPIQPPVVVAPVSGSGWQSTAGAAPVSGPGTGAGGQGDGRGSGDGGDGDGGGGSPLRWIKGRIKDSDYPRGAASAGIGGTVEVRYTVDVDGRVSGCRVTHSSGFAELDETTCRLLTQRFRFKPERDRGGRAVPATVEEAHEWVTHGRESDEPES